MSKEPVAWLYQNTICRTKATTNKTKALMNHIFDTPIEPLYTDTPPSTVYQLIRTGHEDYDLLDTFQYKESAEALLASCVEYEKTPHPLLYLGRSQHTEDTIEAGEAYETNHPAGSYNACATNYHIIEITVK